jgi:SPP1 gp7 family putative phage head morphogenesis protein|nr:MAG TPA_asm: minor capsid protein [Caudoviricetes sp.]
MDKKSKEYWEKRARENENKVYKKASDLKKELDVHYIQAKKEIQKSINDLIARYMFKTDLSYADAMKYLTSKEFKEFRMSLEEYEAEIERLSAINEELANKLRIELETLAMKSRITRLDSLKTQIDIELSKKISKDYNVVEKGISEVYRDFFKIQTTDFGLTGVNTVLPKKTLKMLMQQPWSGANFSERIWGNSEALGKVLKQEIIQSFMQGVSVKDLSDRIEKRFENDRYNTERLVRTELNYAFNQTTKLSYEEAEIEEYEFLAEIDSRTSEICKKLNGEKFKVKDARAGVNYPPMHPHCRSTTVAVLDFDNFGKEKDIKNEIKLEKNDIIEEKKDWIGLKYISEKYKKPEAIERLKKVHGIQFEDSKNYPIDEKLLSSCITWLDIFSENYPNFIEKNPCKIPKLSIKDPVEMKEAIGFYSYYTKSNKVIELALNGKYHSNLDEFEDYLKKCEEYNWYPKNAKIYKTFIHEYGHHISNSLKHITRIETWQDDFIIECINEFNTKFTKSISSFQDMGEYVSEYAATSNSELFAESFAEYFGGENPRDFAKIFGIKLIRILKGV